VGGDGPNAGHLVGADGHSEAGATDEQGPVGVAGGDEACCANRDVRVFGRLVVDPNVDDLRDMVVGLQVRAEGVLVLHSGVVGSDDDA
jgi:hypothetical protein